MQVTPVIYVSQISVALTDPALSIIWRRKDGTGAESNLIAGETISGNQLRVAQNVLGASASKLVTYIARVTYTDPATGAPSTASADISFALVQTGADAKSIWISGDQVFKYGANNNVTPTQITLKANLKNATVDQWWYRNGSGEWVNYPGTPDNATIKGETLIVKPVHGCFVGDVAAIRVTTAAAGLEDIISIYKVRDGGEGASAPIVFLTNEVIQYAANAAGQVPQTAVKCNVVAYRGTTKETPTVVTITGLPDGMSAVIGATQNNEIPLTIMTDAGATLGGAGVQHGGLGVPVTSPVNTTLTIRWSKVNTGAQGQQGEPGTDAVVFSLYAPEGAVFNNHEGTLTIKVSAYHGSVPITAGATYSWAKYESGAWKTLPGTTATLTVNGADVPGTAAYRCRMVYEGKTYEDVITLQDKTDNVQAVIDSTGGSVFKNGVGEAFLFCRIWQGANEIDELRSASFDKAAVSNPAAGFIHYRVVSNGPATALYRYTGSAWQNVTSVAPYKHAYQYKWYRRDKNGAAMDGGGTFAQGKVIFVTGNHVDNKAVFTCEVEEL